MSEKSKIVRIIQSAREKCSWDENSRCYTWHSPERKLTGITKRLKAIFWPNAPSPRRVPKSEIVEKKGSRGPGRGAKIHEQLVRFVQREKPLSEKLDPITDLIIYRIRSLGLTIISAEFCVGDLELSLGTGVDILCVDQSGKIHIIEIKTGFENVIYDDERVTAMMSKPFDKLLRTNLWAQHQLQLLATVGLFERMTGLKTSYADVWVVGSPQNNGSCSFARWPLSARLIPFVNQLLYSLSKRIQKPEVTISSAIERDEKKATKSTKKRIRQTSDEGMTEAIIEHHPQKKSKCGTNNERQRGPRHAEVQDLRKMATNGVSALDFDDKSSKKKRNHEDVSKREIIVLDDIQNFIIQQSTSQHELSHVNSSEKITHRHFDTRYFPEIQTTQSVASGSLTRSDRAVRIDTEAQDNFFSALMQTAFRFF